MTGPDEPMPHDALDDELADLALGQLDGRRRAVLLQHVESCPRCLAQVERLTMAADGVVHLAPELEPPVGFENRLFDRFTQAATPASVTAAHRWGLGGRWRPRTTRARLGLVATAALMALLGVGAGWALRGGDGANPASTQARPALEAELIGSGKSHGEVYVSAGRPAWLTMTVKSVAVSGTVQCRITTDRGVSYVLGSFSLHDGHGTWDAALPVAADQVERAQLLSSSAEVLATASIRA
jgi:hypothetical protein